MKGSDYIKVPSGYVLATHDHPTYGPCIVAEQTGPVTIIRTTGGGTAAVPTSSITERNA